MSRRLFLSRNVEGAAGAPGRGGEVVLRPADAGHGAAGAGGGLPLRQERARGAAGGGAR
jgi:hypothetical protein